MPTTTEKPAPKSAKVQPVPEWMHTVTPHLVCAGAAKAIDFYVQAFGAQETFRLPDGQGRIIHASLRIGDSSIMLNDEIPSCGAVGPKTVGGTPVTIHLQVEDVDTVVKNAIAAGATVKMPVEDMFWGDRYGVLEDPFGHQWSVATHIRDVSPEEMKEAMTCMEG